MTEIYLLIAACLIVAMITGFFLGYWCGLQYNKLELLKANYEGQKEAYYQAAMIIGTTPTGSSLDLKRVK